MTNRAIPNEAACPVDVDLLASLLRSNKFEITETVGSLPMSQRANLAAFCYSRSHMRSLSFQVAAHCDERSLRLVGGWAGEILIEQSRNPTPYDVGPKATGKKSVSLAHSAA